MIDLFGGHPDTTPLGNASDVQLLDTTLRDGEQAPGVSLTPAEKARIARRLDAADVDVIEAGSACTGPGERETIDRVTDLALDARGDSAAQRRWIVGAWAATLLAIGASLGGLGQWLLVDDLLKCLMRHRIDSRRVTTNA